MKFTAILIASFVLASCTVLESNRAGVPFLTKSGAAKKTFFQGSYSLPRRYVSYKVLANHRHFNVADHFSVVESTPAADLVPDPSSAFRFDVNYAPSRFSRDKITIEMADQMLSSVVVATKDATDDVLVNFAQAAAQLARLSSGLQTAPRGFSTFDAPGASSDADKIDKVVAQISFDPTDVKSVNRAKKRLGHMMNLRIQPEPRAITTYPACNFAICYRPLTTVLVSFEEPHSGNSTDFLVQVPDPHQIAGLDLERSVFVDRDTTLTFSGGTLQKIDMEKPSELAEAALLPVRIVDAVFSGVGNAVTGLLGLKKNELKGSTDLLNAQAEYLNALVKYRETVGNSQVQSGTGNTQKSGAQNAGPGIFQTPGGQASTLDSNLEEGETTTTTTTAGLFGGTPGNQSGNEAPQTFVVTCKADKTCELALQ